MSSEQSKKSNGVRQLFVVGVMGSGSDNHIELAVAMGEALAKRNVHLLTGGGDGVMRSVAQGFTSEPTRNGMSIGILRGNTDGTILRSGDPNEYVEIAIRTHLPDSGVNGQSPTSRNHLNILSSDAIIILPGSAGTASEIALAKQYKKPVIIHVSWSHAYPDMQSWQQVDDCLAWLDQQLLRFYQS